MQEKRLPKLDARLEAIYYMVSNVDSVADIGCDHGRLSLSLAHSGLKVIATDISKPSLEKATHLAKKHDVIVDTRFGDGLIKIKPNEVQAIVIAGMGQNTIQSILSNSKEIAEGAKYIIMQSMNGDYDLRRYLSDNKYKIADEQLVLDGRRLYCIIKAIPKSDECILKEIECYLGPVLIKSNDENFGLYLDSNIEVVKEIIYGIRNAKILDKKRLLSLSTILKSMMELKYD